jgi:hypothetical protein
MVLGQVALWTREGNWQTVEKGGGHGEAGVHLPFTSRSWEPFVMAYYTTSSGLLRDESAMTKLPGMHCWSNGWWNRCIHPNFVPVHATCPRVRSVCVYIAQICRNRTKAGKKRNLGWQKRENIPLLGWARCGAGTSLRHMGWQGSEQGQGAAHMKGSGRCRGSWGSTRHQVHDELRTLHLSKWRRQGAHDGRQLAVGSSPPPWRALRTWRPVSQHTRSPR